MEFQKSLTKFLKSNGFFLVLALIVLFVGLNLYSRNKSMILSPFTSKLNSTSFNNSNTPNTSDTSDTSDVQGFEAPDGSAAPITGITSPEPNGAGCATKQISDPADLLPKDTNSEWAQLNPNGVGDLENISLLQAGHHIGINTVGSTLKNANLQVRSEPVIPKTSVGPFLNSSIEPDCSRPKLEIGGPSC